MRYVYLLLFCLLAGYGTFAQEGVGFRDITLEEALQQAQTENKLVFMDCYTSWCGPCQEMTKKVFPQKAAGDYFNPRFVSVKYDMEKGAGVELAKKYEVHAYPTFLIIRPDGTIQHRLVGADNLETFIARVEKGLNENTNLAALHRLYQEGQLDKTGLFGYWEALEEAGEDSQAEKVYAELLEQLTEQEKMQAAYWNLYNTRSCTIGSPMFNFLLDNLSAIRQNVGEKTVDKFLYEHYSKVLSDHIAGYAKEDTPSVELLAKHIAGFQINGQKSLEQMLTLAGPVSRKEIDKVAKMLEQKIPQASSGEVKMYAFGFRAILWTSQEPYPKQYGKLGKKLSRLLIATMESKAASLSGMNLSDYSVALSCFGDVLEQKDYVRLVALGDKILPNLPDDNDKRHAEWTFKQYKKYAQPSKK